MKSPTVVAAAISFLTTGLAIVMPALMTPVAHATTLPIVTGMKYGQASSVLRDAGLQPVVATTVGDREAWPDCLVAFVQRRDRQDPPNSGGGKTTLALVSLNCDGDVASATTPGYSAQSPEAKAINTAAESAQ